jgi:hypothetical protein
MLKFLNSCLLYLTQIVIFNRRLHLASKHIAPFNVGPLSEKNTCNQRFHVTENMISVYTNTTQNKNM